MNAKCFTRPGAFSPRAKGRIQVHVDRAVLVDPSRISALISALPTDPDAPRTTAPCVLDMKCLSSM